MRIQHRRLPIVLIIALLLSSCSGAPGPDDLRPLIAQDVRNDLARVRSAAHAIGGDSAVAFMRALGAPDPADVTIEHVKVLDSRGLDNGDYAITVRYDMVAGDQRQIRDATLRVDKIDGHWRLLPE